MKYTGNCHCKKVSFEVDMNIEGALTCNCSHCFVKGLLLGFVPKSSFTLLTGEDNLTTYQFNKRVIDHTFCKDCGVQAFSFANSPDGTPTAAINLRTLNGLDVASLPVTSFDGKDL